LVFSELVGASAVKSDYQNVKTELILLALPAIGGQALEPFAQLMETAFIGRLGTSKATKLFPLAEIYLEICISSDLFLISSGLVVIAVVIQLFLLVGVCGFLQSTETQNYLLSLLIV
jgi:Na+-driven multidrug efflux pump